MLSRIASCVFLRRGRSHSPPAGSPRRRCRPASRGHRATRRPNWFQSAEARAPPWPWGRPSRPRVSRVPPLWRQFGAFATSRAFAASEPLPLPLPSRVRCLGALGAFAAADALAASGALAGSAASPPPGLLQAQGVSPPRALWGALWLARGLGRFRLCGGAVLGRGGLCRLGFAAAIGFRSDS